MKRHKEKPRVGVSMGDPAGVGPELCLRMIMDEAVRRRCVPVVFGDMSVLRAVSSATGLALPETSMPWAKWTEVCRNGRPLPGREAPLVVDCGAIDGSLVHPGKISKACGAAAVAYIKAAVGAALGGQILAVATAPIHKEALKRAGVPYPGHTEMLAALTGARRVCMMLASDEITVSLVTTHVPLADVSDRISEERVYDVIELTYEAMKRLGKKEPRLAVCGLNPHGGEHGLMGGEEARKIEPAVQRARRAGWNVQGPWPPDTAFLAERRQNIDAYVVMYHDQGLIPFKMIAFEKGVNITLGLPVIRTSVDHGTAFDIAWQGTASERSLVESVLWALRLAATKGARA